MIYSFEIFVVDTGCEFHPNRFVITWHKISVLFCNLSIRVYHRKINLYPSIEDFSIKKRKKIIIIITSGTREGGKRGQGAGAGDRNDQQTFNEQFDIML
mgnify:CR=1 FL=1